MEIVKGRPFILVLGLTACAGIVINFVYNISIKHETGESVADEIIKLLGYFTILTNIIVAVTASVIGLWPSSKLGQLFSRPAVFGGIVVSIVIVGGIYHLFLASQYSPKGIGLLVNTIEHTVVPIGAVLYWFIYTPEKRLPLWAPLVWCIYPVTYGIYVIIRGSIINKYPYYFIDLSELSVSEVAINSLGVFVTFIVCGYVLIAA
ncbi:MAG: Pr6Pr family membrane protein, partial [Planctomycetes bacterium]|nr:Pr6Pr family membrane protein [Planctomycetota bacterium]